MANVTEVEVAASRKKQLGDYEPAESYVSMTAEVGDTESPEEVIEVLQEKAGRMAKEDVLRKYNEYVREEYASQEDD